MRIPKLANGLIALLALNGCSEKPANPIKQINYLAPLSLTQKDSDGRLPPPLWSINYKTSTSSSPSVTVADMNKDSIQDIIVAIPQFDKTSVYILYGLENGTYSIERPSK